MSDFIDINRLDLSELLGVVNLYPWFGYARMELCRRMGKAGGLEKRQVSDAAIYVADKRKLAGILRSSDSMNWEDAELEKLLRSYIAEDSTESAEMRGKRKVYAGVGDYFTQDDYDQVRQSDDNVFSRYAAKARQDRSDSDKIDVEFDLYTETLAQIYAEQGYYEQAKRIYSKLILAYPEKSAYFASLIQKMNEFI
ncbi:MAG: hypothetical protein IJN02_03565 [Bacteroidales bacterium]|nr:hypothetical protein [Bacteroidales bacterium]